MMDQSTPLETQSDASEQKIEEHMLFESSKQRSPDHRKVISKKFSKTCRSGRSNHSEQNSTLQRKLPVK